MKNDKKLSKGICNRRANMGAVFYYFLRIIANLFHSLPQDSLNYYGAIIVEKNYIKMIMRI